MPVFEVDGSPTQDHHRCQQLSMPDPVESSASDHRRTSEKPPTPRQDSLGACFENSSGQGLRARRGGWRGATRAHIREKSVTEEQRSQPPRPAARPPEIFSKHALSPKPTPSNSRPFASIRGSNSLVLQRPDFPQRSQIKFPLLGERARVRASLPAPNPNLPSNSRPFASIRGSNNLLPRTTDLSQRSRSRFPLLGERVRGRASLITYWNSLRPSPFLSVSRPFASICGCNSLVLQSPDSPHGSQTKFPLLGERARVRASLLTISNFLGQKSSQSNSRPFASIRGSLSFLSPNPPSALA